MEWSASCALGDAARPREELAPDCPGHEPPGSDHECLRDRDELAQVTEAEASQERSGCRGCHRSAREHGGDRTGAQYVGGVDARSPGSRRVHGRRDPSAMERGDVDQFVNDVFRTEFLAEHTDQSKTGVGDGVIVIRSIGCVATPISTGEGTFIACGRTLSTPHSRRIQAQRMLRIASAELTSSPPPGSTASAVTTPFSITMA